MNEFPVFSGCGEEGFAVSSEALLLRKNCWSTTTSSTTMGSDDRRDDADDEISAGDLIHMADDSSFR